MEQLEIPKQLRALHETINGFLIKDLSAMDEEQAGQKAHPDFRSPIQIVAHAAGTSQYFAKMISGDPSPSLSDEERQTFMDSITTRAEAIATLESSAQELYRVIESIEAEQWGEIVEGGLGPMSKMYAVMFAALHTSYHDGQINHLHVMNGDSKMHWF